MTENIISDGEYTIEVGLSGGSGRANIVSPAKLNAVDGQITAEIEWSSSSYDYMKIDGKEYFPENKNGNSVFVIDVPKLDADMPVFAETTAMSQPHMIEYTLNFDSSTLKSESSAASIISVTLTIGAILTAAAAFFTIKRRSHDKK